ncbi:MAG TPA: hypothetical protein VM100_09350, partial [Longimicrobiales bacterium]|nr:hypothetical protein [Longimicrobiales bacterium]
MNYRTMRVAVALLTLVPTVTLAQQPQRAKFTSIEEAARAPLGGRGGPRSVNWIDGGERFAYTINNPDTRAEEIRRFDPATLKDDLLLDARELKMPGTEQPFVYNSFQWSRDSQYMLFQTNFRPIFRRSGLADFYLYSVGAKSLQIVAKDARTAEL